ncbi:MAG: UbiD family decarboxylase [Planctomycetaceae bacterium]|nr:UbiD family decarboxylase [Planctomycetaceae bacterium]MBT6920260.1 UbiD family decarboxylase [Planctomycetaceae bacterium]
MGFRTLRQCVETLREEGQLIEIDYPINPHLEIAEIQRRLFRSGGPALLFRSVLGTQHPVLINLYGTQKRVERLFSDTLDRVRRLVELKIDPAAAIQKPLRYWRSPLDAITMVPRHVRRGNVLTRNIPLTSLPGVTGWPGDGGPFITLPAVYSEHPDAPSLKNSNLGMYRVQLRGNRYEENTEVGLHYQIHRGIGIHHAAAIAKGEPLKVSIFIGGTPSMAVSAMMPLPEGLSELAFAGALAGHRIPMIRRKGRPSIYADADFVIEGTIAPDLTKPEGPFGDHLGYYARQHNFPVMRIDNVWQREDAIWPITVVGRPPQEDTLFGWLVHEITGPIIPTVLPGISSIHAVDAAGVHPLLLAVGSERYLPWKNSSRPAELLTQASAILGQGQLSLAKYLFIVNQADDPSIKASDIQRFFNHVLQRVDWKRDCHFHTETTIDTLDYTGKGFNNGSKLVVAARGQPVRGLPTEISGDIRLPLGFSKPFACMPGVLVITGPLIQPRPSLEASDEKSIWSTTEQQAQWTEDIERFTRLIHQADDIMKWPLIVVTDDSEFSAANLENFLWVTFTRSNPATDVHGIGEATHQKHWGCTGPLVIDARLKPHHAPPVEEDPDVVTKVDNLCRRSGPLAGIIE